jgi:hypothetical protein
MVVMTRMATKEKGGAQKVFWYFPIIPHVKRLFTNNESELL